ncbi:MAG: dTDP-glucose 4,6-dehydratase [Magnetococcales bacterium]|nr:dTDP-glucose 4,6-dehydratase [Magnetococcales bacterium]
MANLMVTGGAGFIGANFVRYWLQNHPQDQLLVLDALTYAGSKTNLQELKNSSSFRFVHGDICDYNLVCQLLRSGEIDTLVHFAAESHVDRSIHGPDAFIRANILGTHALLKAAKTVWLDEQAGKKHRFHHVSTDEVYGSLQPHDPPFTENTPYAPNSPYSASKGASDHLVRAYHHTYGLETTISNCSNNYGPYQFPEKLIPLLIVHILECKALPVYGDGLNVRDWLYVDDHVRGIEQILQQGQPGEVYNIGGNNEWKNIDIVHLICQEMDQAFARTAALATRYPKAPQNAGKSASSLITFVQDRLGHDRRYAIDASKITRALGYQPNERFETGIKKTIAWYLENEVWWRKIMAREAS